MQLNMAQVKGLLTEGAHVAPYVHIQLSYCTVLLRNILLKILSDLHTCIVCILSVCVGHQFQFLRDCEMNALLVVILLHESKDFIIDNTVTAYTSNVLHLQT